MATEIKNMNDLAVAVSKLEGKKNNLNIADIKETLRCLKEVVSEDPKAFYIWDKYVSDIK